MKQDAVKHLTFAVEALLDTVGSLATDNTCYGARRLIIAKAIHVERIWCSSQPCFRAISTSKLRGPIPVEVVEASIRPASESLS